MSEKLVSALRAIASQMDLFEIHTRRDEFAEKVKEHVRADLEENGLLLESVTISELDQTDPSELSDNNVFDAQGKKKITEITAAAMVERNRLDRDAERSAPRRTSRRASRCWSWSASGRRRRRASRPRSPRSRRRRSARRRKRRSSGPGDRHGAGRAAEGGASRRRSPATRRCSRRRSRRNWP